MKRHRLYLILASSLILVCASAAEPLTLTPWDVRKEAEEILEDLAKPNQDSGELLARVNRLLARHGSELIAVQTGSTPGAAPISVVIAERLAVAGLRERFVRDSESPAKIRLAELVAARAGSVELLALARSVPGTTVASTCWRRIADAAWDAGNLRLFRDASIGAGDVADALRSTRLHAAEALATDPIAELPATLDGIDAMWQVGVTRTPVVANNLNVDRRGFPQDPEVQSRPALSACGDGAIAISDGKVLLVLDHLVGNTLGTPLAVGQHVLPLQSARPEPVPGGAVAVGLTDLHLVLVCASSSGTQRWSYSCPRSNVEAVSAPIHIDGLVAVAYREVNDSQITLRVLAVSVRDGTLKWDIAIAQLAASRWTIDEVPPPSLARHARGLAVLANAGLFGLVGSDGSVRRIWSYPIKPIVDLPDPRMRRGRRGLMASDGNTVVATPSDHPGLVLVLGAEDLAPRAYRGDGADGDILDVHNGSALLAGRQVSLLNLTHLRLDWSVPQRLTDAQGILGTDHALVSGNDQFWFLLISRRDGKPSTGKVLNKRSSLAYRDGVLIAANTDEIRGIGDAAAFLARLHAAADTAGPDPRPHAALAAVLAGRGEDELALVAWRKALQLGAGVDVAERMAALLRRRILAGTAHATAALNELATLERHLPGVVQECHFWRGQIAEATGNRAEATAAYSAVLAAAQRPVTLPDGLIVSSHLLAAAGAERMGEVGLWNALDTTSPTASSKLGAWNVSIRCRGTGIIHGDHAFAFGNGLLRSWNLADGNERWRRKPQRALLGVSPGDVRSDLGVAIKVLPGSAGEAAGLHDGDILLSLNGRQLKDFETDLRPLVLELGGGAAFSFEVEGPVGRRTITGNLGGETVEPLACDGSTLLVRATMPLAQNRSDLLFFAVDAVTGADLWSHTLGADQDRLTRWMPLLCAGVVLAADGPDLVGLGRAGERLWGISGRADLLERARPIGRCVWLIGSAGDGLLLDPRTGIELVRVGSVHPDGDIALSATGLAVREAGGHLAIWDISQGRLRCRTNAGVKPMLLRGDALLARDGHDRAVVLDMRTGELRRAIADGEIEAAAISSKSVFLSIIGAEHRSLMAVACDGLVRSWTLDLPPGLEIQSLMPAGNGVLATIREGSQNWAMLIDGTGTPVASAGWPDDRASVIATGDGMLVLEPDGVRTVLRGSLTTPAPLPMHDLGMTGTVKEAMTAQAGHLTWRGDGPAVAVARHGGRLVVGVRIPPAAAGKPGIPRTHVIARGDTLGTIAQRHLGDAKLWRQIVEANLELDPARLRVGQELQLPPLPAAAGAPSGEDIRLRLTDATGHVANDAVRVALGANGARLINSGSWTLTDHWLTADAAGTGMQVFTVWTPSPARRQGAPLALLLSESEVMPWWLVAGWIPVRDPP